MENLNPNVNVSTPIKSSNESQKWVSKKNPIVAMRQRKFVKVSKNKTDAATAYENLRASQEEFFKNRRCSLVEDDVIEEEIEGISKSGILKRKRERVLEEARNSVPENGVGRVKHFVKAFENILSIPSSIHENHQKVMKWALPGLQNSQYKAETDATDSSMFSASDLVLTSHNLGLNQRVLVSSSWDSSHASVTSRTSSRGRRSRRNSLESAVGGRRWKKKKQQLKVTSQKPFKLRTEQRGKMKEEEFMNKIQQMMTEQEKLRIPIAQGLPWTTDEPECLVKPPVKESTKLIIDLKLHSDVRATDRAEFDHQMAEKLSMMEQYRLERERQQKLEEEEEIKRLRKELVPKAQPMPYFDRPFVPRRSMKHPTVPKEPRFHMPQQKKIKCCME
ncbi:PREDICTED: reticulocyte-binding protein 2 homolog a-like isoform X1 [Lupinus angustifolius]|uniref:reticulocyte-binding protein 2 homolog a-like isoform X1 n=1 Tax=Lupinus angustifolius TaxID=3871 RepID=UPI00092E3395|nr:PREDICTED: reticulocyte-binding protein 2 homolog a-like isoform X1 [Lupinus angustifolius]